MHLKRLFLVLGFATALTLTLAAPAVAATSPEAPAVAGTAWTCDGEVCLGTGPAPLDNSGCNFKVCIYVTGDATRGYSSSGHGSGFYGHIHLWGPGGLNVNGPEANAPVASGGGRGSGQTCAEGWEAVTGGWISVGLPCVQVN